MLAQCTPNFLWLPSPLNNQSPTMKSISSVHCKCLQCSSATLANYCLASQTDIQITARIFLLSCLLNSTRSLCPSDNDHHLLKGQISNNNQGWYTTSANYNRVKNRNYAPNTEDSTFFCGPKPTPKTNLRLFLVL